MRSVLYMLALLLCSSLRAADAPQQVAASRIVEVARQALAARLGADAGTSLKVIGSPEDIRVAAGALSLTARPISGRWPRARAGVPVDVLVDHRVVRSATVWFAVSIHQTVLTYADDEPIGTTSKALHAAPADLDVAVLQEAPLDSITAVAGMRLRRPARAGSPVLLSDFETVPDVDRQQRVQVIAERNGIHLVAHGVANATGNAGDVVDVLVDGTGVPLRARVTDRGVVEVVQ